jgi:thiosulfate sulfurtransferase
MMAGVRQISVSEAKTHLEDGSAVFVDIRDSGSYERGHIPGALPLNDGNVEEFLSQADKGKRTIVCCYHGISSQGAAAYFEERGFTDVYSLIGGYEAWSNQRLP